MNQLDSILKRYSTAVQHGQAEAGLKEAKQRIADLMFDERFKESLKWIGAVRKANATADAVAEALVSLRDEVKPRRGRPKKLSTEKDQRS